MRFVEAIKSQWQASDGVAEWLGHARLGSCGEEAQPLLPWPLSESECHALNQASEEQLRQLAAQVPLIACSPMAS